MPQPLRKTDYYFNENSPAYLNSNGVRRNFANPAYPQNMQTCGQNLAYANPNTVRYPAVKERRGRLKPVPKKNVRKKENSFITLFKALFKLTFIACFFGAFVYYILPYNYSNYFEPMILNRFLNRNINFNAKEFAVPTASYLANSHFMGERLIVPIRHNKAQMVPLAPASRFYSLEDKLTMLSVKYPQIEPAIYVWDYSKSRSVEINANEIYSSASIIKLPVLVELLRYSESLKKAGYKPVEFNKKLQFNEIYRTSGSGSLQYERAGNYYSINHLATIMIQNSDNSATNMLLEQISGMEGLNSAIRKWGLESTQISNWLPDLKGTNTISAKDMATLLYNIDNPKFLNNDSKYLIQQYMSNVKNNTLIHAGLPKEAEFLHKTGDIGTMLGDAGIVYAPNGRKYIVVILTKRKFNDYSARDFIQQASRIIYQSVIENADVY